MSALTQGLSSGFPGPAGPWSQSGRGHRCPTSSAAARRSRDSNAGSRDTCSLASRSCRPSRCTGGNISRAWFDRLGRLVAGPRPSRSGKREGTPLEFEGCRLSASKSLENIQPHCRHSHLNKALSTSSVLKVGSWDTGKRLFEEPYLTSNWQANFVQ